jgi:hypothetical protein
MAYRPLYRFNFSITVEGEIIGIRSMKVSILSNHLEFAVDKAKRLAEEAFEASAHRKGTARIDNVDLIEHIK